MVGMKKCRKIKSEKFYWKKHAQRGDNIKIYLKIKWYGVVWILLAQYFKHCYGYFGSIKGMEYFDHLSALASQEEF
jgi:hypothetical protein